jgi:hypothetical protein
MTADSDATRDWSPDGNPPTVAPQQGLPTSVLAAAVILIVVAVLIALMALFILFSAALMNSISDPSVFGDFEGSITREQLEAGMSIAGGFFIVFAIIALLLSGSHFVGAIGILRRRSWGRITGLVLSFLALLVLLIGLGSTIASFGQVPIYPANSGFSEEQLEQVARTGAIVGLTVTAIFTAAYGYVAAVLLRRGDVFRD